MKDYREILKEREYRKLLAADAIGRFGDSVDAIAFTWLTYALTGSAAWASVIFGLNQIPNVFLQPFAGVVVEKTDKKRVLIITDMIRCVLVLMTVIVYTAGYISPWYLAAFTLCMTSAEVFHIPAATAFVPRVMDKEMYTYGLSLSSAVSRIATLIGMGVAGLIVGAFGVSFAFVIDGATFLLSAMFISAIKTRENEEATTGKVHVVATSYGVLLKEGLRYVRGNRLLINYCVLAVLINAILVPYNALQAPLAVEVYGLGPESLSAVGVAVSAGAILGSFLTPFLMKRMKILRIIVCSGVLSGLFMLGLLLGGQFRGRMIPACTVAMLCAGGMCMCICFIGGILNVQFMTNVKEEYLARSSAIFNAFATASMPVLSFVIGGAAPFVPVNIIILASGCLCIFLFMIIGVLRVDYGEVAAQ